MPLSRHDQQTKQALDAWKFLLTNEGSRLLEAARDCPIGDAASMSQLRRQWSREQVAAAIELAEARRRAVGKFQQASTLLSDRVGLEQATGTVIGDYKAGRLAAAGVDRVTDLCCGIGGDAMALAKRMEVEGIDIDPLKAWMTSKNAGCQTRCSDILELELPPGALHIDPGRRDTDRGIRQHDPERWTPPASSLEPLLQSHPDTVIKMGPGIDMDQLSLRKTGRELEFISLDGSLSQSILWTGCFAGASLRATRCSKDGGMPLSLQADHETSPPVLVPNWKDSWLHVPDPAVERARLLGLLCEEWNLAEPAAGLGILVGNSPAASDWLIPYEVVAQMPWRIEPIKQWLGTHDSGEVEVRTRGHAVKDVDKVRSTLKGSGKTAWTVFGLRLGQARVAIMTRPRNGPRSTT